MKAPSNCATIQIELTNACHHSCSNCTRLCGHHKEPFFMDFETFKRAVDSLEGFEGTIGMMGGEPTLHPEFTRFTEYLNEHTLEENRKTENWFVYPQRYFGRAIHEQELVNKVPVSCDNGKREGIKGMGIWSAMGRNFKKNYELIQDTYKKEMLNDHNNQILHQPVLVTRKELGISDEEWLKLRENCWINRNWSASITPKGCFFCEIAATLDRIFDGPGGWPIEKGWWRRGEKDLEDQLHWCELCGIPLNTFSRDSREEVDDVSPVLYDMLKKVNSPKIQKGKVNCIEISEGVISEKSKESVREYRGENYADIYEDRFSDKKTLLYPNGFECFMICESILNVDELYSKIINNAKMVQKLWIFVDSNIEYKVKTMVPNNVYFLDRTKNLGNSFNYVLKQMDWNNYLFVCSDNIALSREGIDYLSKCVINPGTLHYANYSNIDERSTKYVKNADALKSGFIALLNKNAMSLQRFGFDRIARIDSFEQIKGMWQKEKIVELSPRMEYIPPNNVLKEDCRYVIFGTGTIGRIVERLIKRTSGATIVCVVDSDKNKQGKECFGCIVESPDVLVDKKGSFDQIVIATHYYYAEMKKKLFEMGFTNADITMY